MKKLSRLYRSIYSIIILALMFSEISEGQISRNSTSLELNILFPKISTRTWGYMGKADYNDISYSPLLGISFYYNLNFWLGKKWYLNLTPGATFSDMYYSGLMLGFNIQKYINSKWYTSIGFLGKFTLAQSGGHNYMNAEFFRPLAFVRLGKYVSKNIALNLSFYHPLDNIYGKSYSCGYGNRSDVARTYYLRYIISAGIEYAR